MTNADRFKGIFGLYATELWSKTEKEFLEWLNADVPDSDVGDTISRQAAIDAVNKALKRVFVDNGEKSIGEKIIGELPSAQQERKKGEWIPEFDGKFTGGGYWFSCSKCKRIVPEVRNGGWNFCPNCGAEMKGKSDELE